MKRKLLSFLLALALVLGLGGTALAAEPVTAASGGWPSGLLLTDDALLVTDLFHKVVWHVTDQGKELYAGKIGVAGLSGEPAGAYSDGSLETARFASPWAIAPFLDGYAVTDAGNNVVRYISEDGVTTLAGSGSTGYLNGTGRGTAFYYPTGLAADGSGNLYVADTGNNVIRKITSGGSVTTYATGFLEPTGLCWYNGVLYVADSGHHRICGVENGEVTVLAGGVDGQTPSDGVYEGDYVNAAASNAKFSSPQGVAVAADGSVYVADSGNGAVRRIADGRVSTFLAPATGEDVIWPVSPRDLLIDGDKLYISDNFAGVVTLVSLAEEPVSFSDVPGDAWFAGAVTYAARAGILSGTGGNAFSPFAELDRAMAVTMLSRLYGGSYPYVIITGEAAFSDVAADTWYSGAAAWAADNSITGGVGGGCFGPERTITRQELACLLWRFARLIGADTAVGSADALDAFPDAGDLDAWAAEAMEWAVDKGIFSGSDTGLLRPLAAVTRAQAAQVLLNFSTLLP